MAKKKEVKKETVKEDVKETKERKVDDNGKCNKCGEKIGVLEDCTICKCGAFPR